MSESNYSLNIFCPNMKINPARIPMNECLQRITLNIKNLSIVALALLHSLVDLFKSKSYLKCMYLYNDPYACIIIISVHSEAVQQALDPRLACYDSTKRLIQTSQPTPPGLVSTNS